MKRHRYILFYISIIACLTIGCGKTSKEPLATYNAAALISQTEEIPLTSIAQDIRKIQLETNDSILISSIWKLYETSDKLVIFQDDRCMVFDKTGKYLNDISKKGEGPYEFTSLWDMFMQDDTVCIVDRQAKKLRFYELNGKPVKEIKTPQTIASATYAGNGLYVGFIENRVGNRSNKLIYFDETGTKKDSVKCVEKYTNKGLATTFLFDGMFFNAGMEKNFKEIFNDTIYAIQPDHSLRPRIVFDMGQYSATFEKRFNLTDPREDFFGEMARLTIVGENDRNLFFNVTLDKKTYTYYLDKQHNLLHQAHFSYPPEFKMETGFVPQTISKDNKRIISYIEDEVGEMNPTVVIVTLNN